MKKLIFPEFTNNDINTALLCDKLNEVIEFINGLKLFTEPMKLSEIQGVTPSTFCQHDFYVMNKKTGLKKCKKCKIIVKGEL